MTEHVFAAATETAALAIIGIAFDGATGWQRIAGDGAPLPEHDFASDPIYSGIVTDEIGGHVVVRIPAFYVRAEAQNGKRRLFVSPSAQPGFVLHPAFATPNGARPYISVGAYAAGQEHDQVVVRASVKPWTSINFDRAETACLAMGKGWHLWTIHELAAVQLLALIEVGTPALQQAIGRGNVDWDEIKAGGETNATWRGLSELWGNVWQMVDGLRLDLDGRMEIRNPTAGGWVETGLTYGPGTNHGYPTAFHDETGTGFDLSLLFLPSTVSKARDDAAITDYVWGHWSGDWTVAYAGGDWGSGDDAGLFALVLNYGRSDAGGAIGFRPAFAPSAI